MRRPGGRGNAIQNDQMAQMKPTEGGRNAIQRPEKAESRKNRKPAEGKSKSITVSQRMVVKATAGAQKVLSAKPY